MHTSDADRFERLEHQVRRLRRLVIVMGIGFAGVLGLGATSQPGELTLRRLAVVDSAGRERIVVGAASDTAVRIDHFDEAGIKRVSAWTNRGGAGVSHYDKAGTRRIFAETRENGWALAAHVDQKGIPRVSTSTYIDGAAGSEYLDAEGKQRIVLRTAADGLASVTQLDRNQLARIAGTTLPDGAAAIQISDRDGKSTWSQGSP
jgi:hypothetical protein